MTTETNAEPDETSEHTEAGMNDSPPAPGDVLREERERRTLSVQEVADELHLTMHYVRALEAGAYDKLPSDVFVRGYIRSYARLLELDPDYVLDLYHGVGEKKQARKQEARKRFARRRKDKNRPWIIFSGVAFITMAFVLWFFNSAGESRVENGAGEQTVRGTPAAPQSVSQQPQQVPGNETVQNQTAETVPGSEAALENNSLSLADGGRDTDSVAADADESDTSQETGNANLISLDWNGEDVLRIAFDADSWVEIEARSGAQRHRSMRSAGDTIEVTGTAPFYVLLGDARTVQLNFNSRHIDIRTNVRADNSARLTVGL